MDTSTYQSAAPSSLSFAGPFGLPPRQCLARLDAGEFPLPEQKLSHLTAELRSRQDRIGVLGDERDKAREQKARRDRQLYHARHEYYSMVVRIDDEGLHLLEGHASPIEMLESAGLVPPGEPIGKKQSDKHVLIVRRIPDEIVYREDEHGVSLHGRVAAVNSARCREVFCELILKGESAATIGRGVRAARTALLMGQSEEEALIAAGDAMADARKYRKERALEGERLVQAILGVVEEVAGLHVRRQVEARLRAEPGPEKETERRITPRGKKKQSAQAKAGAPVVQVTDAPAAEPVPASPAPAAPAAAEPVPATAAAAEPVPATAAAAEPAPAATADPHVEIRQQEPWDIPIVRALSAHLLPEETPALTEHLLAALTGAPPAPFVALARSIGERMIAKEPHLQKDFRTWLRHAASADRATRWRYICNFFVIAQLPGFHDHVQGLRSVQLHPEAEQFLDVLQTHFPLITEVPDPQPETEEEATLHYASCLFKEISARYQRLMDGGGTADTEMCAQAFAEFLDTKDAIVGLLRDLGVEAGEGPG